MNEELNRLVSPESILIIDSRGVLWRLKCPFKAVCILSDSFLLEGQIYMIQAVVLSEEELMLYVVKGKPYYYYCFAILL